MFNVFLSSFIRRFNFRHLTTRSYGAVYKAEEKSSHEFRAIKIVPVEKELDELMNEIKILKKCNSEYITRYYGSYQHDDDVWVRIAKDWYALVCNCQYCFVIVALIFFLHLFHELQYCE